ncbi:MAG: ribosome-binding factor A [bacterium]|nr:ribosome-binding factor A [bacterium]
MPQVNHLIREAVSEVLSRDFELPQGCLVTVSRVATSADLKQAKVWVKIFPVSLMEEVGTMLRRKRSEIQEHLNGKVVLKFMPRLTFLVDESEEKADHINQLLDSISYDE